MRQDSFRVALALITLLSVAAVLISPAVDLQPTAMRASRDAKLAFPALAIAAGVLVSICGETAPADRSPHLQSQFTRGPDLFDLTCSRLC